MMVAGQWRQRREWVQTYLRRAAMQFGKNDNKKIHVHIEMTFVRLRGIKRACVRG